MIDWLDMYKLLGEKGITEIEQDESVTYFAIEGNTYIFVMIDDTEYIIPFNVPPISTLNALKEYYEQEKKKIEEHPFKKFI